MAKSGPIGQVEAFYIEHHHKKLSVQELADILDRKVETVKLYIKKNIAASHTHVKAGDHFAKSKGTIVMTETASSIGDAQRKRKPFKSDCVTKIKHD
jgi:hypothetical protein